MRRYYFSTLLLATAFLASNLLADSSPSNQIHDFRLIVTSTTDREVPLEGSIAVRSEAGEYVQIVGHTPYEKRVKGYSFIAIVNSKELGNSFNAILEVDGKAELAGRRNGDQLVVYGRNMPGSTGFASSF